MYPINKKILIVLIAALVVSMVLTGCGGTNSESTGSGSNSNDAEQNAAGYTHRTSKENTVAYENGEFTPVDGTSVLITSIGQSADVSMLDALMKNLPVEYTLDKLADAGTVKNYNTIIICAGASSKGLGAAGISAEEEMARAKKIIDVVKQDDSKEVILVHLGGQARRGTLSDGFIKVLLEIADHMIVVEEGNTDGIFTDYAAKNNVPIALVFNISDALEPLQKLFGEK
mgnify:CR=1 FL=1